MWNLILDGKKLTDVNLFTYLGSWASNDGSTPTEVNIHISTARGAYTRLNHLWRLPGILLKLEGPMYCATVRSVHLYGCETCSMLVGDIRRLEVFNLRCIRIITRFGWSDRVRNVGIRNLVLCAGSEHTSSHRM